MTVPMAMLALLDSGPSHGFDLKRRYDVLLGQDRALKYGQVYATLQRLERDGLAAGVGLEPGGGADRKIYAITAEGVTELDAWLAETAPPTARRDGLFARVVLALASGRPPEAVLDAHRRAFLDRMRELTAGRGEADAIRRLAADYEIAHLEADLQWIELAGARLATAADSPPGQRGGLAGAAGPDPQPAPGAAAPKRPAPAAPKRPTPAAPKRPTPAAPKPAGCGTGGGRAAEGARP